MKTKKNFLANADTLTFLNENNLDFNKLFKLGLPYVRAREHREFKDRCMHKLAETTLPLERRSIVALSEKNLREFDNKLLDIDAWVYNS
jgi:poly(A)-specific ribonuclease